MTTYIDGKQLSTNTEVLIQDVSYLSSATIGGFAQTAYIFLEHNESYIVFTIISDENPNQIHPVGSWTGVSGTGDFFLPMDNGMSGSPLAQPYSSVNYGVQNPSLYPASGIYYATYIFKNPPPYIKFFNNSATALTGYTSSFKSYL